MTCSSSAKHLDVCLRLVNGKNAFHFSFSHTHSGSISVCLSLSLHMQMQEVVLRIKCREILALFDLSSIGWTFETSWWCNHPLSSLLSAMKISLSLSPVHAWTHTHVVHRYQWGRPTCPRKDQDDKVYWVPTEKSPPPLVLHEKLPPTKYTIL